MRMGDWSSDVCSSDLVIANGNNVTAEAEFVAKEATGKVDVVFTFDASLLDHTEGLDEVAVAAQAHAGNVVVVQTTQRLHSVVSVLRDLDLSEKIRLRAELLSVLLLHQTATLNPTTSLRAEE